jgi:hypothetical protein
MMYSVTVAAYIFAAEVSIYELAFLRPPCPSPYNALLDHKRTEYMIACVEICKACTERYLVSDLIHMTMASGLTFSYCAKTLHRLSTLQDPNWDTAIVTNAVNVVELLERCADAADRSNDTLKAETGEDSVLAIAAKTLRDMAPSWRVPIAQESQMANGDAVMDGWTSTEGLDLQLMDFTDDFWLNGPFNPYLASNRMNSRCWS